LVLRIYISIYVIIWVAITLTGAVSLLGKRSENRLFKFKYLGTLGACLALCIIYLCLSVHSIFKDYGKVDIGNIDNPPDNLTDPIWRDSYVDIPFNGWVVIKYKDTFCLFSIVAYVDAQKNVLYNYYLIQKYNSTYKIIDSAKGTVHWNKLIVNRICINNKIFIDILPPNKVIYSKLYAYDYINEFNENNLGQLNGLKFSRKRNGAMMGK
jgi:hypothetical protein